jgi:hypothetical protein
MGSWRTCDIHRNPPRLTSISSNLTTGNYQQHRFAIQSQGAPIACAQAQFNVAKTGINEE